MPLGVWSLSVDDIPLPIDDIQLPKDDIPLPIDDILSSCMGVVRALTTGVTRGGTRWKLAFAERGYGPDIATEAFAGLLVIRRSRAFESAPRRHLRAATEGV
jgi:hypothetical protein